MLLHELETVLQLLQSVCLLGSEHLAAHAGTFENAHHVHALVVEIERGRLAE